MCSGWATLIYSFFIEVSVWAATKIDLYPVLLKVQDPDFSKWGPTLLRISNVLLIHTPFIDVLVQICPFYSAISLASTDVCLRVLARVYVCVFGGFEHLFSLSGVEKPVSGSGNGNHFVFFYFWWFGSNVSALRRVRLIWALGKIC